MSDCTSFIDELVKNGTVGYDPLGSFEQEEIPVPSLEDDDYDGEGAEGEGGEGGEEWPTDRIQNAYDESLPASERIETLFRHMEPRRNTLLGIIRFCETPRAVEDLDQHINHLQKENYSVFTPANLVQLLERASALEKVNADGTAYVEPDEAPEIVEVDGAQYYAPAAAPVAFWVSTQAAMDFANSDNPLGRLQEMFVEDSIYKPIYLQILQLCAAEGGAETKLLAKTLDNHEILQSPRFYSAFFIDKLANCGALEWADAWCITDLGKQALEILEKENL